MAPVSDTHTHAHTQGCHAPRSRHQETSHAQLCLCVRGSGWGGGSQAFAQLGHTNPDLLTTSVRHAVPEPASVRVPRCICAVRRQSKVTITVVLCSKMPVCALMQGAPLTT